MKILVVTHNYPRHPGDPAGAFIARLAQGAAAAGHDLTVLAPHAPGLVEDQQDGPVRVRRFRYAPDAMERVAYTGDMQRRGRSPAGIVALLLFLRRYRRALRAVARELRPDVVHAHWWFPGGWVASAARVPYVVTCHGTDVRLLEATWVFRWLARKVLGRAAAVTAVSAFLADDLERLLGTAIQRPTVVRMPVVGDDLARGQSVPKAQPPRLLYVGNLNPSKGVDVLIRAMTFLRDRSVACRVRIVGDGPAKPDLEALARSLGVAEFVEFAGRVPLDRMAAEYGAATVTVLPTRGRAEGLGLALVESLLAGTAVVGSPAGGIPEVVIPEETGLLARDGDPADLATQLARMLNDQAFRDHTAARGRERVKRTFSLETTLPVLLDIYRDAASRTAR